VRRALLVTLCCLVALPAAQSAAAPAPRLVVTVVNPWARAVGGLDVAVRNLETEKVVRRGVTDSPDGRLVVAELPAGHYRVAARTPRAQLPLRLRDVVDVRLGARGRRVVTLGIGAPCRAPGEAAPGETVPAALEPATYFARGGRADLVPSDDPVVRGSQRADVIPSPGGGIVCGNGGDDRVKLWLDRVLVLGGTGDDRLTSSLYVGSTLFGGAGDDVLSGGQGQDRLRGGPGDDRLTGDVSVDDLDGGSGDDLLAPGPHAADRYTDLGVLRQRARCGPGTDRLDRRDVWQPFVQDTSHPTPQEADEVARLKANPNFTPLSSGCEIETPMP
jgi:hemolysin type calcium-binding protein